MAKVRSDGFTITVRRSPTWGSTLPLGALAVSVERVQTRAADTDGQFGGVLALVEVPDAVDGENFCSRCDTDGPESLSSQRHP